MDREILERLVNEGLSVRQISKRINLTATPVRKWLKKYNLQTIPSKKSGRKWTDSEMIKALSEKNTISDVLKELNLSVRPGNYETVNRFINKNGIDVSHMIGKASGRGRRNHIPLEKVLVQNSTYSRYNLKKRIIKEKLIKKECAICNLNNIWNNKPLVLVLDHINGVNNDNRLENLRFLCPNCNSQTETFCRK